jgi:hypothetical protein
MPMAGNAARNSRFALVRMWPCTPADEEQRKLDRLRELRATIEALRGDQESEDPLLAWVKSRQQPGDG